MHTLVSDLRFAARQLRKSPAFAATAVVSLAVGLAASTSVFSLADALLFRARPGIDAADRLVDVGRTQRGSGFDTMSYPNYADLRDRITAFEGVAAYRIETEALSLEAGAAWSASTGCWCRGTTSRCWACGRRAAASSCPPRKA